jgi:RNA polymerase sigma-70 factor (ECF subfamily)
VPTRRRHDARLGLGPALEDPYHAGDHSLVSIVCFVALLTEDASFAMPPWLQWYAGREILGSFFTEAWKTCGGLRLVESGANGQPAFAVYERSATHGRFVAHAIHVLTVEHDAIVAVTAFQPPSGPELFRFFGLPQSL